VASRISSSRRRHPPLAVHGAAQKDEPTPLRLSVTRGALGIELYRPLLLGPLSVEQLLLSLPGLRFPLDLSGGVPVFRHRRGRLERLVLESSAGKLVDWLGPRLRDVLDGLVRPVGLWAEPEAIGVGLAGESAALAFELLWAPDVDTARFVVAGARGVGLDGPALGYALRAMDSAMGRFSQRRGRLIEVHDVGQQVGRAVLPLVGARAPSARGLQFGQLQAEDGRLAVELDGALLPPVLGERAARGFELAQHCRDGDDALAGGDLELARTRYLAALEQAPRHPELIGLVADIDLAVGGREEAALGMLVEAMQAVSAGWTGAQLLCAVGDFTGAREAVAEAARQERYAPLAALLWERLAQLQPDSALKREALDRAVACAPGLHHARWARLSTLVDTGHVEAALADAQHLEAAASGARERHAACRRAAAALLQAGFVVEAGRLFERALRYVPDDAAATAGLARSLTEAGHGERAFSLLERAIQLSERGGRADADALLDLARLLAERYGDLPQAIARARQVSARAPRAAEARYLEGYWRAKLGDRVGATLAFGRMRELVEHKTPPPSDASRWLLEAADFERSTRDDLTAAERHLTVALRVAPRDPAVQRAFREVGAHLAGARSESGATRPDAPAGAAADAGGGREALEEEVERLKMALQANPSDPELGWRLASRLEVLGRDHELYAWLAARLEDAEPDERPELEARARKTLRRLVERARADGRLDESELYEAALRRL